MHYTVIPLNGSLTLISQENNWTQHSKAREEQFAMPRLKTKLEIQKSTWQLNSDTPTKESGFSTPNDAFFLARHYLVLVKDAGLRRAI